MRITNPRYTDDTTLIARISVELLALMKRAKAASEQFRLYFKVKKDYNHEVVDTFYFLGSMIIKDGVSPVNIRRQMAMAKTKTTASTLSNIWKARNISRATKKRVMEVLVYISNCPLWM